MSASESEDRMSPETKHSILSAKSRKLYDKCYEDFIDWRMQRKTTSFSESVLLDYFQELSNTLKCSSLWSKYSMMKSTLSMYNGVDVSKYQKLITFLKGKSQGFQGKKAKTFTSEQLKEFINEAPDRDYLLTKVVLIYGIMGACRRYELYNLQYQDVEISDEKILVSVRDKKNTNVRTFCITGNYFEICKEYIALRPKTCKKGCFFLNYHRGKCTTQRVGINKFGILGKTIADYLKLPNSKQYTGQCFKRTSTTLADAGLKRHSCKSTTMAEVNIDDSEPNNMLVTNSILNSVEIKNDEISINNMPKAMTPSTGDTSTNANTPAVHMHFHNCTIQNLTNIVNN